MQFDAWWLQASTISRVVDTCIFEFLSGFEIFFLHLHNVFRAFNRLVSLKVPLFDLFDTLLVLRSQLVELLVGHLTNGTPLVRHITFDTLGIEVGGKGLVLKLPHSSLGVSHLDNLGIWVEVLSCRKFLKALHSVLQRCNQISADFSSIHRVAAGSNLPVGDESRTLADV